jgi:hypothetical protein
MMEEKNKYIETLLERFFEGQTSNEEERQLYLFFKQDELPDELAQYKQVIKYFESGLADELGCTKEKREEAETRSVTKYPTLAKRRWLLWGSVAASVLILLFSTLFILNETESADPYAGSYIIRNGVRITDLNLIKPELEAAIQKSLLLEQEADRLVDRLMAIDDSQEIEIMQQMQEHNQRILDNTQDSTIRNEVEEILNLNL